MVSSEQFVAHLVAVGRLAVMPVSGFGLDFVVQAFVDYPNYLPLFLSYLSIIFDYSFQS
jgi:hypothetical protein